MHSEMPCNIGERGAIGALPCVRDVIRTHSTADSAERELLPWLANMHIQKVPAVGRSERSQPLLLGNREDGFGKLRMPEQTIHLRRLITCEVIQIGEGVSYL